MGLAGAAVVVQAGAVLVAELEADLVERAVRVVAAVQAGAVLVGELEVVVQVGLGE